MCRRPVRIGLCPHLWYEDHRFPAILHLRSAPVWHGRSRLARLVCNPRPAAETGHYIRRRPAGRDVLYVEDLIAAYVAAVSSIQTTTGQAYNIGGGPSNTLSLLELVTILN